ncbi:phosphoglycerate mutase-like protein [Pholiota conissans]|uniref:Phosphoglycerate mutase-like protein n=1 Tax=Pholiota conissans TaxID=109636 RepID=A0A9P6CZ20_9AGAR|nr:phosphoglycerate mutase-like protein [Pholiota conissans]
MTSETRRVYLVRHGETQANRDGIIQGQQDTVLNAMGEEQARLVGEALKDVEFRLAFSSDLSRAVKTAEAILAHHPGVELVKEKALRERFMGTMEGQSVKQLGGLSAHGAETAKAFGRRGMEWWQTRIAGDGSPGNVLVTSHGGLITSLVRALVDSGKVRCARGVRVGTCVNASVTVIDVGKRSLVQYADAGHLTSTVVESNADEIEAT